MPKGERYLFIDGLRGVAAVAVLVYHFSMLGVFTAYQSHVTASWFEVAIIARGHLGVQIFFVLSGFVMAHSLRNAEASAGYLGRFILRRSLRLDPAYFLASAIMVAAAWGTIAAPTWRIVLANAVYAQTISGIPSILPPAWSLCYEAQFYLVLILLLMGSRKIGGDMAAVIVSTAMGVVSIVWYAKTGDAHLGWFINLWFQFELGLLTYWTAKGLSERWLFAFVLTLAVVAYWCDQLGRERIIVCVLTAAVILLASRRGKLSSWLGGAVWQFLGGISYSVYLLHWPAAVAVTRLPASSAWTWPALAIGGTILGAWAVQRWVERPGIRLGRRWRDRRIVVEAGDARVELEHPRSPPQFGVAAGEAFDVVPRL